MTQLLLSLRLALVRCALMQISKLVRVILPVLFLTATVWASDDVRVVTVRYRLDASIAQTNFPSMTWQGSGPLHYKWHEGEGVIRGADVPFMRSILPLQVAGYQTIMVTVQGQPRSDAVIKRVGDTLQVAGVDLDIIVSEGSAGIAVPPPLLTARNVLYAVPLRNLQLTSGDLEWDGRVLHGKIDGDAMSAELVFTAIVPATGDADLDKQIAGKVIVGRLTIALDRS